MPPIVEGAVEPELVEVGLLAEDVEVKCPLEEIKTPRAMVPAAKNRKRSKVTRNRQLMQPEAEEQIADSALGIFVALEAVSRTTNPKAEWVIKRMTETWKEDPLEAVVAVEVVDSEEEECVGVVEALGADMAEEASEAAAGVASGAAEEEAVDVVEAAEVQQMVKAARKQQEKTKIIIKTTPKKKQAKKNNLNTGAEKKERKEYTKIETKI